MQNEATMSFKAKDKAAVAPSRSRIRIGSRVPDENREWLKRHGIVTDHAFPKESLSRLASPATFSFEKGMIFLAAIFICGLPAVFFVQQSSFSKKIQMEKDSVRHLSAANEHLRGNVEQLSAINMVQQSEINRMALQLRNVTQGFHHQVIGFQKGEAMSDALHLVYDGEIEKLGRRYDLEVETLRSQMAEKDRMIASLESSFDSMDGVVVHANPISTTGALANGKLVAINSDFQFVVVDIGELKGSSVGQMVEFYKQGNLIGYGEVEKVYPDFSGVRVFSSAVMAQLDKGDAVFIQQAAGF